MISCGHVVDRYEINHVQAQRNTFVAFNSQQLETACGCMASSDLLTITNIIIDSLIGFNEGLDMWQCSILLLVGYLFLV